MSFGRRQGATRTGRWVQFVAVGGVLALVLSACGDGDDETDEPIADTDDEADDPADDPADDDGEPDDADDDLTIAFAAASSQNAFNAAVYEGVEAKAAELGVQTRIFDGQFDAEVQWGQIEDVTAAGQADGIIVLPNDTVGIAPVLEEAIAAGIPVVTTLFPVGPELTTLEPQVDGITSTVAAPPAEGAGLMAEEVVGFCADLDPCRVVIMVGQLQFPFDNVRYEAWLEVLEPHDNIEILATGEGNYDRDTALTAMTDILQAHSDVHAVLSGADQHLFGIELALEDAGYDVQEVYTIGLGAAREAVQRIRDGLWDATKADFPFTMGELALEQIVNELRGEPVEQIVNMDEVPELPPILTQEVLEEHADFEGEFDG